MTLRLFRPLATQSRSDVEFARPQRGAIGREATPALVEMPANPSGTDQSATEKGLQVSANNT